jgi:homoserine O-acetyltransferase
MLVEKKLMNLSQAFTTEGGVALSTPQAAYEEYGNPEGPVIVICHGGISSHHAAGKHAESDLAPGWWDGLIGPGKTFDTRRFRILAMNALGGMFGTSSPLALDPLTGCRYGPTFPAITLRDQVRFLGAFLDTLGVGRLYCIAGPSMGSLHALTFAALFPERIERVVAVASAGRMTASGMAIHHFMMNSFRMDPAFQGGWYDPKTPLAASKMIWQVIKLYYTSEKLYQATCFDSVPHAPGAQAARSAKAGAFLTAGLDNGIAHHDANSFIASLSAINTHDLGEGFASFEEGVRRIKCPVLLVSIDTDHEFPPCEADEIAGILNAVRPGQATTRVIESLWGHLGCIHENEQLAAFIGKWLAGQAESLVGRGLSTRRRGDAVDDHVGQQLGEALGGEPAAHPLLTE